MMCVSRFHFNLYHSAFVAFYLCTVCIWIILACVYCICMAPVDLRKKLQFKIKNFITTAFVFIIITWIVVLT